jgi:hypothetical protein
MNNTKLFHVDAIYSVMVAARNERDAERLIKEQLGSVMRNERPDITCSGLVTKVNRDWAGSIPYGATHDQPCEYFTGENVTNLS